MIAKTIKGANFSGVLRYVVKDGRGEVIAMQGLCSTEIPEVASEMTVAASLSARTKKPVMHIVLSYDHGLNPTNAECKEDGAAVLRAMGLADHQAVMVRHRDKEHHHIHIIANRVGPDGKAARDSHSYARMETTLRGLEAEKGLIATLGRHAPSRAIGARYGAVKQSTDPRQAHVPEGVKTALLTAQSWRQLDDELAIHGWRMEKTQRAGKKAGALLVGPDGEKVAAGRIDRNATLSKITHRIDAAAQRPTSSMILAREPMLELGSGLTRSALNMRIGLGSLIRATTETTRLIGQRSKTGRTKIGARSLTKGLGL